MNILHEQLARIDKSITNYSETQTIDPNAVILSTAYNNEVSSRVVLVKEINRDGIIFYSNYNSRKAKAIEDNNLASMLFYFREIKQQIRIEGKVQKVSPKTSDEYFKTRHKNSKIGAIASKQSETLESREEFEKRFHDVQHRYPDSEIPRPNHWGGYLLSPHYIEFWHERDFRLHDREVFDAKDGTLKRYKLYP